MIECKCWLDKVTGKVMFDNPEIAVAFNIQKQEFYQEQYSKQNIKRRLRQDIVWVTDTSFDELSAWKIIKEIADEEISRLEPI